MSIEMRFDQSSLFNTFRMQDIEETIARRDLVRYFIPSCEATILELGSGLGEVVSALEDSCKRIFALETDHTMFSALNADINSKTDHPIIAIPSTLSELNLKEEINVIYSFNYFSFLPELSKSIEIQAAFEALQEDGYLIFTHSQFVSDPSHTLTNPETIFNNNEMFVEKTSEILTQIEESIYEVKFNFRLLFRNLVVSVANRQSILYLQQPDRSIEMCMEVGFKDAWIYKDLSLNSYQAESSSYLVVARK